MSKNRICPICQKSLYKGNEVLPIRAVWPVKIDGKKVLVCSHHPLPSEMVPINQPKKVMALTLIMIIFLCPFSNAADQCQDPGLSKELKKACYESVAMCKELGCSVSILCYERNHVKS